ncbi:hypothetical protein C471_06243 [Halorubrum saccharovorum DSM 1137]|uniref:Uncharacterized protein n=1 Tax=Halorubrum saccharovorum DSM 1137 TaxID=1227484 RepID=M0E3Y9_9EURY|nr:hypothetical protein C471_06243 [Halorubrum saccharovorum DSM 1137]
MRLCDGSPLFLFQYLMLTRSHLKLLSDILIVGTMLIFPIPKPRFGLRLALMMTSQNLLNKFTRI